MQKKLTVCSGNSGPKVKSDCLVTLELGNEGGIIVHLESKVKVFYGTSIEKLCHEILNFFGISHATVYVQDSGALPWVIAARMEAAIKQVVDTDKEYLFPMISQNVYDSYRDRFRFSRLYLPGNSPYMMLNAGVHKPHGLILDLEDAVASDRKAEARYLVRNALRSLDLYGVERMVRINQGEMGIEDLKFVVPHNVHLLLLPKCEGAHDVVCVEEEIARIKEEKGIEKPIFLMPIIESALGVEKAFEIAMASRNIVALAIGLEDYTADMGVKRTTSAKESLYARSRLVNACHAAKIQPIDSVFSDVADMDALADNVKMSKSLGFEGMGCIHPRQIKVIHDHFAPDDKEIERAQKVVNAFFEAQEKGLGVVSLGTKMIDPPVVKRHQKIIDLAINLGFISKDWRKDYGG